MKTLLVLLLIFSAPVVLAQSAFDIVKKADEKMQGEQTSTVVMSMQIVRPKYTRTLQFKSWTKGRDLSMTLILAPAKDKGQSYLKLKKEMWNWNPSISKMIKLPASMMSQGWMNSDYTNDDLLNPSSIVTDYTHQMSGNEVIDNINCWKISLLPKDESAVVWGKVVLWISKDGEYFILKSAYYDEEMELVKTETASDIKVFSGRKIPSRIELIPADKPNQKTVITIDDARFNMPIDDSFFSQQNMKRLQ